MVSQSNALTDEDESEMMTDLDRLIERIDAGESTIPLSEPMEEEIKFKQPLDKVIGVRVTDAQWKRLCAEAEELGIGPTTLVRMWMIEKLRALDHQRQPA